MKAKTSLETEDALDGPDYKICVRVHFRTNNRIRFMLNFRVKSKIIKKKKSYIKEQVKQSF